jgi:natural product precursor
MMKKLKRLKLNELSLNEIEKKEMGALTGGMCTCSCLYYEENGVDTYENGDANAGDDGDEDDQQSPSGDNYCFQNNSYIGCVSGY